MAFATGQPISPMLGALSQYQILLVDDDPTNLQVLSNCLMPQGYRLLHATHGERALSICQNTTPDLVLLDVGLPGMDGFEVCRQLKALRSLADTPVVFLSAFKDSASKVKGFQAGGVDYVDKPFNYDELLARVETHLTLKIARQKLARQNEEIESLLHVLSHDLSNPLSAIMGFCQLASILPTYQDPDTQELWRNVHLALAQQEEIIEHVREMRALEMGKKTIELTPVNLGDSLLTVAKIFHHKLSEKQIHLDLQLTPEKENWKVMAEYTSLTHNVMSNLVSNAIKFSDRGKTVSISLEEEPVGKIHLSVADQGIGIPDDLLKTIFSNDQPTSRPGTEMELGTGFGMPLVKKYVEIYGGEIEVESMSRVSGGGTSGTTIHLRLKRA
ncbi:MAG: hybrid sensor histidine kinase/response regulator [Deltaproteobacteria bacterium]|nr:hybrid sensor histidine kinase/response regulator [Deltaproteobacteria bacterium]